MTSMNAAEYIEALTRAGDRMVSVLGGLDLETPVPSCPEWVARDLVRHVAGVHSWAKAIVGGRLAAQPGRDMEQLVGGWPPDDELLEWFAAGYRDLARILREAPEQLRCWTFLEADSPLLHWARRQAHETSIHRVDAELTAGLDPEPFAPAFASDGVDELVMAFITRRNSGPRSISPTSFGMRCTDSGEAWTVYYDDQKAVSVRSSDPDADALVRAPASDLYQWVWHRLPRDSAELVGDPKVIDDWNSVQVRWS